MDIFGKNPSFHVGEVVYERHGSFGPRVQPNLQLVYVFRGEASVEVDGRERVLYPGDATLLLPGHEETFRFSRRSRTHHGWAEVLGARLAPEATEAFAALPEVATLSSRAMNLHAMAVTLWPLRSSNARRLFESLGAAILCDHLESSGFALASESVVPAAVARAQAIIERRCAEPLDMEMLASAAQMSARHMTRLFERHLGLTPTEYLWQVRCENAVRMMHDTGLSLGEIAYACGFQNPYHFSRVMHRRYGVPPGMLRRQ
jgi:AraC-like DNA-binding protein